MENFWYAWALLILVNGMALVSPGPDFIMIVRNALTHGRRAGIWTALGLTCGITLHVSYNLIGIAALISHSILLFNVIKYAGAAYLIYVGWQALRSRGMNVDMDMDTAGAPKTMSAFAAWKCGFVTNILNPKATLFFLALFSQFITPETPHAHQAVFALTAILMCPLWFSTVAFVLTTPRVRAAFLRMSKWIDRSCGALFIALGLKLALTRAPH